MTSSLFEITSKYRNNIEIIALVRLFFQNKNEFNLKCIQLSKPHLKTYICLLLENYNSTKDPVDVLFDVEYVLKSFLTRAQDENVLDELLDILTLTIAFAAENQTLDSSKQHLEEYMHQMKYVDESTGWCQLAIAAIVYDFYPELIDRSARRSIIKCIVSETSEIHSRSIKLVKQMLAENKYSDLMEDLMAELKRNKIASRIKSLKMCCSLIDDEAFVKACANQSQFQTFIQKEMLCKDKTVYKCAMFILQRLIKLNLIDGDGTLLNMSERCEPWEVFFLLQETLDEKQSHLIMPVLELLPKTKVLPSNWHYVLITRILTSENVTVFAYGVRYVLNNIVCSSETIHSDNVMNTFFTSLMNALNTTSIFSKPDFPVVKLKEFFAPIFDIAVEKFLTINWRAVPMYHVVNSLIDLIIDRYCDKSHILTDTLIQMLRLVNKIPNVPIRKRIKSNLRRIMSHITGPLHVETFSQLVSLADVDCMNGFRKLMTFDDWSHEDVVDFISNETLGDKIKESFLSWKDLTEQDLSSILELMKMNELPFFHVFETLAISHSNFFHCWLERTLLKEDDMKPEMVLSMYYLFRNIIGYNGDIEVATFLSQCYLLDHDSRIPKQIHQIRGLQLVVFAISNTICDRRKFLERLIEHGTEESMLVVFDIVASKEWRDCSDLLEALFTSVADSQKAVLIERLIDFENHAEIATMQEIYSKLFQAVNNKHLLLYKLASKFLTEDKCFLESESNLGHIQRMLLYGNPATGDQRVENDLCQLLYNDFDWAAPSHIRFEFIDKFLRNVDGNAATQLRNTLYEMSVNLNLSKSRYYPDSEQHRLKLRLVQALAILKDHRLNEAILTEQNQVNVTYIMELIVAATSDIKDAVALLEQAKTNSARQSIFVIMYYVCSRLRDAKGSDICIEKIIPFTMGQHFNTRLLAQVTIVKLIEKFYSLDDKFHRHHAVYEQIKISFSHGNAKQISEKFLQDFRFTCIDCDNLLHQIYILYEIPRITKMAEDELFPLRLLKTDLEDETFLFKEPFYVHTNFSNVYENECLRLGVDVESNGYTLQKKLIPIKSMRPDPDLLVTLPCDTYRRYGEGLIVVANLVSRLPNLGGLTRTCEIFGVEQLILDSLKRVENPEFQSVSMTSEKWMNIGELKTWQLFDYLMSMKSNGYYIVGAEQTSNGKMLTDLNFPKKTVLLLGSEKDGIPANLLSVLDVAVEIPQFGVVRSLNVHVSAALFVWEYTKQHMRELQICQQTQQQKH